MNNSLQIFLKLLPLLHLFQFLQPLFRNRGLQSLLNCKIASSLVFNSLLQCTVVATICSIDSDACDSFPAATIEEERTKRYCIGKGKRTCRRKGKVEREELFTVQYHARINEMENNASDRDMARVGSRENKTATPADDLVILPLLNFLGLLWRASSWNASRVGDVIESIHE